MGRFDPGCGRHICPPPDCFLGSRSACLCGGGLPIIRSCVRAGGARLKRARPARHKATLPSKWRRPHRSSPP